MDGIVFLSKRTEIQFIEAGLDERYTTTIYNFHDLKVEDQEIRTKINRLRTKHILELVFIGSINERKGILDLLCALKRIDIPFVLHVCGVANDDIIEKEFNSQIAQFTNGSVIVHGYVSGEPKKTILLNSDILVLPSYSEGFPLVLLEGVATGCAIIASDVGAVAEVFDERNGIIINPGDIESLSAAISHLASVDLGEYAIRNYELSKHYSLDSFLFNTLNFIGAISDCGGCR